MVGLSGDQLETFNISRIYINRQHISIIGTSLDGSRAHLSPRVRMVLMSDSSLPSK